MCAIELASARLRLRPPAPSDLDALAALSADPEVMEHYPAPLSRAESEAVLQRIRAHFETHGYGMWVMTPAGALAAEAASDTLLGICGLQHATFTLAQPPPIEIGWRLARRWWGRGLVTEAATAALDFAFRRLALPEVVACTVPDNRRSRAVMTRLGMQHVEDGDFEHVRIPEGHRLRRHVLYRLERLRWQRGRGALP